jgi:hypothetical protein
MADRSVKVTFVNQTDQRLTLTGTQLEGSWTGQPPAVIEPNATVSWGSQSKGFLKGTEGTATYSSPAGTFTIHWNNPYAGSNSYDGTDPDGYHTQVTGGAGNHADVTYWLTHTAPSNPHPDVPVHTLQVRVVTSGDYLSGTDNDVYFDVGPLGWKLDSPADDFEAGSDHTYGPLDLHGLPLRTGHFLWLRLQKKGVLGYTGTGDGADGSWKPASIQVLVDGAPWASATINEWLTDPTRPVWRTDLRPGLTDADRFAWSLRALPNEHLTGLDEAVAYVTTAVFKSNGISGWLGTDLGRATVTGTLVRPPAMSTDGFATIDLSAERLDVAGRTFLLDGQHDVPLAPRYLRVEYLNPGPLPADGQRVQISGQVVIDSDRESWWEIHPASPADVVLL